MKKWLYTLLVIVLAACSNEIPEQQPAKRSGRTVLAYEEFYKLKYCSTVVYMVPRA